MSNKENYKISALLTLCAILGACVGGAIVLVLLIMSG
jgi:hypothetical protein